jgi:hypothetical protein
MTASGRFCPSGTDKAQAENSATGRAFPLDAPARQRINARTGSSLSLKRRIIIKFNFNKKEKKFK